MGLSESRAGALRPGPEPEWVVVHGLKTFVYGIILPIVSEQEALVPRP